MNDYDKLQGAREAAQWAAQGNQLNTGGYAAGPVLKQYSAPAYAQPGGMDMAPMGKIGQGLLEQERLLGTLHEELSALEQRLDPLLRPNLPATTAKCAPQATPSPIAQGLERFNGDTHRAIQRVRELAARIDL